MKNLSVRFRARVGNHVDRGRVPLVRQIPAIQKNGESIAASKPDAEAKQYITIGKQRVRLIHRITRKITLQVWTNRSRKVASQIANRFARNRVTRKTCGHLLESAGYPRQRARFLFG